jgi:O-antigen/teichoic acid export membrane protein
MAESLGPGGPPFEDAAVPGPVGQIWRSIGLTSGARIYAVFAGACSLVITARILGPEGRGIVATCVTWALLLSTIGYLSLGQVAIHRASRFPGTEWLGTTLAALMAMAAGVSVLGWLAALCIYLATDGDAFGEVPAWALALGMATLPLLVWEQYGSALLTAVGRLGFYNRAQIAGQTIGVVLILVLVGAAGAGVAGALVALLLAQAVIAAAGWRHLIRLAGPSLSLDRGVLRELLTGGVKLHFNAIGTFLFTNAAVLIVQAIEGSSATGSFQVAVQVVSVALLIPQAASLVLYGEVARLGPDGAWPSNRRVLVWLSALMVAVSALAALLAPHVIPRLFGEDFSDAVPVFQILAFALVGQTFSAVMAPQWIGRGLFWQASAVTVALGLANVVASIFLVDAYGMKGAAYSLLGVYIVSIFGNGAMAVWVNRRVSAAAA